MVDQGVKKISKETIGDPLYQLLHDMCDNEELKSRYLAEYSLQADVRIPDDESRQTALLKRSMLICQGLMAVSNAVASHGTDIGSMVDAVKNFHEAFKFKKGKANWYTITRRIVDRIRGLIALENPQKQDLETILLVINEQSLTLTKDNRWRFVCGIVPALKEICHHQNCDINFITPIFDLLYDMYITSATWGDSKKTYTCILTTLIEIAQEEKKFTQPAKKLLNRIHANLPRNTKNKRVICFKNSLSKAAHAVSVDQIEFVGKEKVSKHSSEGLLIAARKRKFPLDYRTDLIFSAAMSLSKINGPLYHDLQLYVPVRGKASEHAVERFDVTNLAIDFINKTATSTSDVLQKVLLIQGVAGVGKSLFLRYLEKCLWNDYAPGKPIPLFISLPSLTNPGREAVEQVLKSYGCNAEEIARFKAERTFVFLLDGFDEIKTEKNIYASNQLKDWKGQVVITARTEYLAGKNYRGLFKADALQDVDDLAECHIVPFEKGQVDDYLKKLAQRPESDWKNWNQYRQVLDSISGLNELVSTPFILSVIAQVLPRLERNQKDSSYLRTVKKVNRATVYETFVEYWFDREERKLRNASVSIPEGYDFKTSFGHYCADLAFRMFINNRMTVQSRGNNYQIQAFVENEWGRFFKTKEESPAIWLARQGAITKQVGNQIGFIHKSILEYFVAKLLHTELVEFSPEHPVQERCFFNQKNVTIEPSIIQFLVDMTEGKYEEIQALLTVLNATKGHPELGIAGANAISILNAAHFSFSGMDLENICIPGAVLDNGMFSATNFKGADLSGVSLRNAFFQGANFTNTKLENIIFGEHPYIEGKTDVWCVAYSSNGKLLASGHTNNLVCLWDPQTGNPIGNPLEWHMYGVSAISFSRDNTLLASAGGNAVCIWDLETHKPIGDPIYHDRHLRSVAISPDKKTIATAGKDRMIFLWDLTTHALIAKTSPHGASILSICFTSDGKKIASASKDKTARLWDGATLEPIGIPMMHTDKLSDLVFSPNGKVLATAGETKAVCLWNVDTQQLIGSPLLHDTFLSTVMFAPDGKTLVSTGRDKIVYLWDVEAQKIITKLYGHQGAVNGLYFSPDGNTLASAADDSVIRLWDLQNNRTIENAVDSYNSPPRQIKFFSEDMLIAENNDNNHCQWDIETGKLIHNPPSPGWLSPDGKKLATEGDKNTICIADIKTGAVTNNVFTHHTAKIKRIVFSPDNSIVASLDESKTLYRWSTDNFEVIGSPLRDQNITIKSPMLFSSDGKLFATVNSDGQISVWHSANMVLIQTLKPHYRQVVSINFSSDGNVLAIGGGPDDKKACLWYFKTNTLIEEPENEHKNSISDIHFNEKNKILVTASTDRTVRFWNTEKKALANPLLSTVVSAPTAGTWRPNFIPTLNRVILTEQCGAIVAPYDLTMLNSIGTILTDFYVSWTPIAHGSTLWGLKPISSGSPDILWSTVELKEVSHSFPPHTRFSVSCFSDDGTVAVIPDESDVLSIWKNCVKIMTVPEKYTGGNFSVSPDGKKAVFINSEHGVTTWDIDQNKPLQEPVKKHTDIIFTIQFSPNGKLFGLSSYDHFISIWSLETGNLAGKLLEGHEGAVEDLIFAPTSDRIITYGLDGRGALWNLKSNELIKDLFTNESRSVCGVCFSPDGKKIGMSLGNTMALWDGKTGQLLHEFPECEKEICTAAFSLDSKTLFCGVLDSTVSHWDLDTYTLKKSSLIGERFNHLGEEIECLALSSGGNKLAVGTNTKGVFLWQAREISKGEKQWFVQWHTPPYVLNLKEVNFTGAIGLSSNNKKLLLQRGAEEKSTVSQQNTKLSSSTVTTFAAKKPDKKGSVNSTSPIIKDEVFGFN